MSDKCYLVSACLIGLCCRFDGCHHRCPTVEILVRRFRAVPVCPEQLGGLPTPRPPAEIAPGGNGDLVLQQKAEVYFLTGEEVTDRFVRGAEQVLLLARLYTPDGIILKEGSPSCGSHRIYDGSFQGRAKDGMGVTAALLRREGFDVYSEENWKKASVIQE